MHSNPIHAHPQIAAYAVAQREAELLANVDMPEFDGVLYDRGGYELLTVQDLIASARLQGAAEREKELLAVGVEPVASHTEKGFSQDAGLIWEETNLYSAEHLAAARLQGAEEERKKWEAEMVLHNNGVLRQRIIDLERVNQQLLDALNRCKFDSLNMSLDDLKFCRSAIAAAEAHTGEQT